MQDYVDRHSVAGPPRCGRFQLCDFVFGRWATVENLGGSPVTDNAAAWARRDGCTGAPVRTTIAADVVLDRYSCPSGMDVQLYSVLGGGHIWPGSDSPLYPEFIVGSNTDSINATALIWDFFRTHPMNT